MKKFTAILVAIVLALFVVSCGGSDNKDKDDTDTTPDEDVVDTDTDTDTDADTVTDTDTDTVPDGDSGDTAVEETCKLGSDLYTIDAERYFAFKGVGTINVSANSEDAQPASLVKIAYDGMKGANFQFGNQLSFYEYGPSNFLQGEDAVALQVYGDVDTTTYRVLTVATVEVPLSYIDFMKENETFELDQAPVTEIAVLKWSTDQKYVQQCIFFGKLVNQQYFNGKTKVCYEKNEEFAAGETFKLSMVAEIGSDEDTVEMFQDIESVEGLCPCFLIDDEHPNGEVVDCSTIEEFNEGDTDPCEPNPCEEGETCEAADNEAGYTCTPATPADPCEPNPCEENEVCAADETAALGYTCTPGTPALTCDAEAHKELNEAGDACVCVIGYNMIEDVCRKQCTSNSDCVENEESCDPMEDVCMPNI